MLRAVRDDRRFQGLAALDLHQRLEEVRGADVGVHPVREGAPRPVVSLLEQAARVGARDVAVVEDPQAGLAHRGHDTDGLVADPEAEVLARLDDVGGVDELLVPVAGDGGVRDRRRVDGDARRPARGVARRLGGPAEQEQAEHHAEHDERHRHDGEHSPLLAVRHDPSSPSSSVVRRQSFCGGVMRLASHGAAPSARLTTTVYVPTSVAKATRAT